MSVANKPLRALGWTIDYLRKNIFVVGITLMLVFSLWPTRYASRYDAIPKEEVFRSLVQKTTPNITKFGTGLTKCDYDSIIDTNTFMLTPENREQLLDPSDIQPGGEYHPNDCAPAFSTAILIPYRSREKQLHDFLIYMHNFLRQQRIHYRIFLIEQNDAKLFNRAKLFNIGYDYARRYDFPCLVLHDVDLMPMNLGHLFACSERPRHMCASLDEFRFNLPYYGLFGGAVAMESSSYVRVNGMSNMFQGWGGEDDDLYERISAKKMDICRFPAVMSQYAMLLHKKEPKNPDRLMYLRTGKNRYHTDGLNSLEYKEREFRLHPLFTHALVDT